MDQALYNGVDLPWVYGPGAALEYVVDIILSPATLAVSNLAGQATGTRGNNIVAEVPGAIPSLQRMHNLVMVPRQLACSEPSRAPVRELIPMPPSRLPIQRLPPAPSAPCFLRVIPRRESSRGARPDPAKCFMHG